MYKRINGVNANRLRYFHMFCQLFNIHGISLIVYFLKRKFPMFNKVQNNGENLQLPKKRN